MLEIPSQQLRPSAPALLSGLLVGAVFLIITLPRLLIINQSATADETKWVARAANFSTALSSGDLANTFQSEHPGVTTMWAGTVGLRLLIPGLAAQQPGQLEPYELDNILQEHGYTPLQALVAGRQVMVLFNSLALTLVFAYTWQLLDMQTALLAAVLGALSPFFVAHTHLMHLDGLAGSLMILSLLAFLSFIKREKKFDLLLSGIAAGLAWLTKTPAMGLGPIMLAITLVMLIWDGSRTIPTHTTRSLIFALSLWTTAAVLTFVLLWPAMWTSPLGTLEHILGEALLYAGGGHGDPVFFNGTIYSDGRIPASIFYYYPLTYLWRSTPGVLLGLALLVPALWYRWPPLDGRSARKSVFALLLYVLIFTIFMTLGDKKFDRYLIPVYPALYVVAAAGWVGLARRLSFHFSVSSLAYLVLALVAIWQLQSFVSVYPYPLSYYNPLLGGGSRAPQVMQVGWGEGLDAAGRYLSDKAGSRSPASEKMTVASWYRSALAYYFNGDTISINADVTPGELEAIHAADYAVIYLHQWQRNLPADLLEEFAARTPEHTIEINGMEYARIYDLQP
ncbi:MAG: ArnT family glycosyltransferase [Candidatus Promineifilaceae bacterium]